MSTPRFCVSFDSYKANICNGLTSLQQHEEFVDMTLAADGHFVKVHQIVVSLASPYLKELILSAPCPHPVVFLNKITYPILCYILEYIYSGEVMVDKESLPEFIAAGKELHIKGLQDMELQYDTMLKKERIGQKNPLLSEQQQEFKSETTIPQVDLTAPNQSFNSNERSFDDNMDDPFADVGEDDHHSDDVNFKTGLQHLQPKLNQSSVNLTLGQSPISSMNTNDVNSKTVQYTLSNQGHLQLILNRFLYHLNYSCKNSAVRTWRCVDSRNIKCRASVTTKNDIVVQRMHAHTHGFHDKKIMKKLQNSAIFTALKDAESQELKEKKSRNA